MNKTLMVMTMVIALAMSTMAGAFADESLNTDDDFEVEYLAAPAVAGLLLEEAGIDNRYGTGKEGGNFIRDVAHEMGDTTDFDGVSKTDVVAYECAVADFLIAQNVDVVASGTGVVDPAASGATATDNSDGTVTLAITAVDLCGDTISDLEPTNDFSVYDSVIGGPFSFGTSAIPGSDTDAWSQSDGTYSVTLERNYFDARPEGYTDGWHRIWDIHVQDELVEDDLVLQTTFSAVDDWVGLFSSSSRWITIETQVDGKLGGFFGVGSDPDTGETGTITGTIDGQGISMTYVRTDIVTDYTADMVGTIADDGLSMSGTWSDSKGNSGSLSLARQ